LNHLKELGLDTHKAHKAAFKLHAHSVLYGHKLTTTRCALEKSSCSQLETFKVFVWSSRIFLFSFLFWLALAVPSKPSSQPIWLKV